MVTRHTFVGPPACGLFDAKLFCADDCPSTCSGAAIQLPSGSASANCAESHRGVASAFAIRAASPAARRAARLLSRRR